MNLTNVFVVDLAGKANITGAAATITRLNATGGAPGGSIQVFSNASASFSFGTLPWNATADQLATVVARQTSYPVTVSRAA
jgi:hypothetical protein